MQGFDADAQAEKLIIEAESRQKADLASRIETLESFCCSLESMLFHVQDEIRKIRGEIERLKDDVNYLYRSI